MLFLLYALIGITGIQLIYYLFIFSRFSSIKYSLQHKDHLPISVLICAQNESKNLQNFLPQIIGQNYPNFEIVLINDRSCDKSLEVMESFLKKFPTKIKIVHVAETKNGGSKKYALSLGIKAATYQHLLFTDADCIPNSTSWIREMAEGFNKEKSIVLGYGAYKTIKNSFLNKLIRFETVMTALQYFSYAKIGIPYMGVGRNLAYTKSLFLKNNGFRNHLHLKSGDDDMFVNQNATAQNIALNISSSSFTISEPKTTFNSWIEQKRRHISTASHYKPLHQFLLGLFYCSQILFWGLAIFLITVSFQLEVVLIIVLLRISIQYVIMSISMQKLKEKNLIVWAPLLEMFLIIIQLFIFIKNIVSKPTHW